MRSSAQCLSQRRMHALGSHVVQRVPGTVELMVPRSLRRHRTARCCSLPRAAKHAAADLHRETGLPRCRFHIRCRFLCYCVVPQVWAAGRRGENRSSASIHRCVVVPVSRSQSRRLSLAVGGRYWLNGCSSRHVLALGDIGMQSPGLAGRLIAGAGRWVPHQDGRGDEGLDCSVWVAIGSQTRRPDNHASRAARRPGRVHMLRSAARATRA